MNKSELLRLLRLKLQAHELRLRADIEKVQELYEIIDAIEKLEEITEIRVSLDSISNHTAAIHDEEKPSC